MLVVPELNLGSVDAINYKARQEKEFLSKIFFRDSFLDEILEPKKFFLIGEKGTGKTAYAVLLNNSDYQNTRSSIRNVSSTDYERFVALKTLSHFQVSSYVDIWKVILMLLISNHLLESEKQNVMNFASFRELKSSIDKYFKNAFTPEVKTGLELVENADAAAKIFAPTGKVEAKIHESEKITGQGFRVALHEIEVSMKAAVESLKLSKNHILFIDGIDIRPESIEFETYIECIRGLAHAAWTLNTEFFQNIRDSRGRIKIMLLLRPDIIDSLSFQNTNAKVHDNGVVLDWRTTYQEFSGSRIFAMIDGLLGKQQNEPEYVRGAAWRHYFKYDLPNLWVAEKTDNPFIGFLRYSFYRPRDIVSYLLRMQEFVKFHENDKSIFTERSFRKCQGEYSDYLLGEVKDHLAFYYSKTDFDELIGFFKYLNGANRFNWEEFVAAYQAFRKGLREDNTTLTALIEGPEAFLQFLYSLNIIGYDELTDDGKTFVHWCFRDRTTTKLNPKVLTHLSGARAKSYSVHAGLARALNVGGSGR